MKPAFSIITPIDLARRGEQLLGRLEQLAILADRHGWELVIGHADRKSELDTALRRLAEVRPSTVLVSERARWGTAKLAALRNRAVEQSRSEILLFLDADIFADGKLFQELASQAAQGRKIAMAPCIYTTAQGASWLDSMGSAAKKEIVEGSLGFLPTEVLHWAMPSSVMALARSDFNALGGFCEDFKGHGFEDLDFMVRFALAYDLVPKSHDFAINKPYKAPFLAEGFRAALATLCIDNLVDGHVALHQFHERDNKERYYKRRNTNAAIFEKRLSEVAANFSGESASVTLFASLLAACRERNLDLARYHALFDARPRYMLKKPLL